MDRRLTVRGGCGKDLLRGGQRALTIPKAHRAEPVAVAISGLSMRREPAMSDGVRADPTGVTFAAPVRSPLPPQIG
jgi:hypothetical protein